MKKNILNTGILVVLIMVFMACEKKDSNNPHEMHWDRDMCVRCKMVISNRKHAVQVINPESNKVYKFDDLGCAIKWFRENDIGWEDNAKIWITDVKSGKWIDAKKAYYDTTHNTPMAYGFSANEKKQSITDNTSEVLDFNEVKKRILERKKQ
ncbi:nitrous oxide reductase accessory protein NosL [Halarcobacter anaerophilus]|uniref:Protein NosL n=1 Tax=Halarcobacter anaerophilus TaxID=877500 RepID=A0A4Q0XZE1_9BACT|nr:nitrous oxide reductase accessory protein NosL [Halarcobacter anaerophilus]QDF28180.1 NosL domain-containing protein [Halarcobacter anaerophilus]RXJ62525.1 hypothetical protein CRV06_10310 [Halarcobacter anaerophilus]